MNLENTDRRRSSHTETSRRRWLVAGGTALMLAGAALSVAAVGTNQAVSNGTVPDRTGPQSTSTPEGASFSYAPGDEDPTIDETVEGIYDGQTFTPTNN